MENFIRFYTILDFKETLTDNTISYYDKYNGDLFTDLI